MPPTPGKAAFAGLFLVSMAILTFELLLTRIFSVTMWYHFAFMAISIAMFGMTVGALIVFLRIGELGEDGLYRGLFWSALATGPLMIAAVVVHVSFPIGGGGPSLRQLAVVFLLASLPVAAGGVCVTLALTRFRAEVVGRLYAFDLVGAALGCVAMVALLRVLDGISAVVACAVLTTLAAGAFAARLERARAAATLAAALALAGLVAYMGHRAAEQDPVVSVRYAKGKQQDQTFYESWNSFSHVSVLEARPGAPLAWSLSTSYPIRSEDYEFHWLLIDAWAGTPILRFDGDLQAVEYLQYDVTNFAYHLRGDGRVLIVGSGGGRDILAARSFGQREIVALEMNPDILRIVEEEFGEFSGRVGSAPGVRLVNDEARSYISRQDERYDVLQLSFIDTYAATGAGAFVLAENSLYTVEAWTTFLEHLSPRGLLTVSRGIGPNNRSEIHRMTALARAALEKIGAEDPERHILVIANLRYQRPPSWGPLAVVMVAREPLTREDLQRTARLCQEMGFHLLKAPGFSASPMLEALAAGNHSWVEANSALDLSAPTDDRPFFFNMLRFRDWFQLPDGATHDPNLQAVSIVVQLVLIVVGLTALCILLPLRYHARNADLRASWRLIVYFAAIGFGFMLVEISLMQRLVIFLGHPIYSLLVILSTLLLAGGIGSRLSAGVTEEALGRGALVRLAALLAVLAAIGLVAGPAVGRFISYTNPVRIAIAVALVAIPGIFMGMGFPLGLRLAGRRSTEIGPWLWGINGATSVLGSVLAVAVAMTMGIAAGFWLGALAYAAALVAFAAEHRVQTRPPAPIAAPASVQVGP